MALAMGRWGCWLVVAVHVVVRGKEAMVHLSPDGVHWSPGGVHWSLLDSVHMHWAGVHVESTQSPRGLHIDSIENI